MNGVEDRLVVKVEGDVGLGSRPLQEIEDLPGEHISHADRHQEGDEDDDYAPAQFLQVLNEGHSQLGHRHLPERLENRKVGWYSFR
jgi:hypothetical protein